MTIDQDLTRSLNEVAREFGFVTSSPRYLYYGGTGKHSMDRYFYTTRKITHKSRKRYVAGIYRYFKTKKQWKLLFTSGYAKKRMAMARALTWAKANR